ncbi:hypothetical protein V1512DRAFT_287546 [Lipomyces arxii]|uniref:uncharacterized protein n=1 Tax=Lipomyces arxii TaxID=56418 RepID=UPI0034CD8F2F
MASILPNEILSIVFAYLSDIDLINFSQTSKAYQKQVVSPSNWKTRCSQWTYWDDLSIFYYQSKSTDDSETDWYSIYSRRQNIDATIRSLLNLYGKNTKRGYALYDQIFDSITQYGIDALDALVLEQRSNRGLERLGCKFMASQTEGFIRRREGVRLWIRIANGELNESDANDFNLFYGSFTYFCGSSLNEYLAFIESSATMIRTALNHLEDVDLSIIARAICTVLTDEYLMAFSDQLDTENLMAPAPEFCFDRSKRHFWSVCGSFAGIAQRLGFKCGPLGLVFLPIVIMYREQAPSEQIFVSLINSGKVYDATEGIEILSRELDGVDYSDFKIASFSTSLRRLKHLVQYNCVPGVVPVTHSWDMYVSHVLGALLQPQNIILEPNSGEQWLIDYLRVFRRIGARRELDIYFSDWFLEGICAKFGPQRLEEYKSSFRNACKSVSNILEREEMGDPDNEDDALLPRRYLIGEVVKYNRYACHGVIISYTPHRLSIADTLNASNVPGPFYVVLLTTGTRVCASEQSLGNSVYNPHNRQHVNTLFASMNAKAELGRYFARFDYDKGLFVQT